MTDHFVFARIIERFMPDLRQRQGINPDQAATCQNILNCHTPDRKSTRLNSSH